jgi:small subunit ribosomal protein S6
MAQLQSLADAPNTLREYETIYILKADTPNDKVAELNTRVRSIIEERGGKVIKLDNWGKRRLAYEVKKQLKGIYLFWDYLGSPDIVVEFERNMRMLDPVIRYMTIVVKSDVDPGTRATEMDEDAYQKAANTAADEEEIMLGRADVERGDDDLDVATGPEESGDFVYRERAAETPAATEATEATETPESGSSEGEEN